MSMDERIPEEAENGRRDFLKGMVAVGEMAASAVGAQLSSVSSAQAQPGRVPGTRDHDAVPATDKTVHGG